MSKPRIKFIGQKSVQLPSLMQFLKKDIGLEGDFFEEIPNSDAVTYVPVTPCSFEY